MLDCIQEDHLSQKNYTMLDISENVLCMKATKSRTTIALKLTVYLL